MPNLDNITTLSNEETGEDKLTTFLMEFLLKEMDLMPDLKSIPEFETFGELVIPSKHIVHRKLGKREC
jgi:hypothetical protein